MGRRIGLELVIAASLLTLAAVATPLLLPGPVDKGVSPAPAHIAISSAPHMPAALKAVLPQPASPQPISPAQTALATHPATTPAISRPHAAAPKPHIASLPPQPEPAPAPASPAQPPAGAAAPSVDLASLPVGTEIVTSGQLNRINRHSRFSANQDMPITITILTPPAHGTVSTQQGIAPVTSNSGATRVSVVTNVFYQSNSNYSGMDSFTYKRTSTDPNDPLNANTYTVQVYVQGAAAQHSADAPAGAQSAAATPPK